jgi:hypothetical protein
LVEGEGVALEDEFFFFEGEVEGAGGAVEGDAKGDLERRGGRAFGAGEVEIEEEFGIATGSGAAGDAVDAEGEVVLSGFGIAEEVEAEALEGAEGGAEGFPAAAGGVPVVLAEVGKEPEVGAAGLVGGDVIESGLEEGWDVGGGGGAAEGREGAEGGGVFEGLGCEGGAVDEDKAGAGSVGFVDGIGEVGEAGGAFGEAGGEVLLLHAGAAVDEEEDGVRCAAGETEEAAGEGATGHEDEGGESEDSES